MLNTPLEQLAYIIEKAREYDAGTAPVDSDSGSNPSDDNDVAILESTADNPTRQELAAAPDALNDDQKIEILALTWLGRGDFDRADWRDALVQAREIHNAIETEYLIGTPLLANYLEEAIAALGYSLEDYEKGRLQPPRGSTCRRLAPMHPITDKAEVAIDFPDKFYSGGFGRDSAFEARAEADGVLIKLVRSGSEKRAVSIHLHYFLLASILEDLGRSIAEREPIDDVHREPLLNAARGLAAALGQAPEPVPKG